MNRIAGAYIEITGKCNERCPYCYNEELMQMSDEIAGTRIVELAEQLLEIGISSVTLSGGEQFLHSDIQMILDGLMVRGIHTTVISNGTCFSEKNRETLIKYHPTLQLTFDGFDKDSHDRTRGAGNFERIVNGFNEIKLLGFTGKVAIRVNLHRQNVPDLEKILSMIDEVFEVDKQGSIVTTIALSYLHKTSPEDSRFSHYFNPSEYGKQLTIKAAVEAWNDKHKLKITDITSEPDIGCPLNGTKEGIECGIRVAINGDVFPCQLFSGKEFSIGNIYVESLNDIINGEKLNQFSMTVRNRRNRIDECKICAFRGICGSGCPGQALIFHGTLDAKTDRCYERKRMLSNTLNEAYKNTAITRSVI